MLDQNLGGGAVAPPLDPPYRALSTTMVHVPSVQIIILNFI